MATRRIPKSDPWTADSGPIEMQDGRLYVRWINGESGEVRHAPEGVHPEGQPNSAMVPAPHAFDEPAEETATDRVAAMLHSVSGADRAEVKLYRDDNGSLDYCAQFTPDEFENGSFEIIRSRFGPGSYELRMYAAHPETGKYGLRARTKIKIAKEAIPSITAPGMPGGLAQVLEAMARSQQQMMDAIVSLKSAPQKDPAEEMAKMFALMGSMRDAMGITNQPQQPQSSIGEILKAVRELREVSQEINPPKEEKETGLMDMLPTVLDLVKGAQAGQAQPVMPSYQPNPGANLSPVTLPASMHVPAPAVQPDPMIDQSLAGAPVAAPAPESQPLDAQTVTVLKLNAYLASIVKMAEENKDPQEAADFIIEHLPDEMLELLELPNWFELLASYAPAVAPHRDWLFKVHPLMFDSTDAT